MRSTPRRSSPSSATIARSSPPPSRSSLRSAAALGATETSVLPPIREVKANGSALSPDELVRLGHLEADSPEVFARATRDRYLTAWGLIGEPVPRLMTSGGAQKKNSYTPSAAQSSASSLR
jgi:hypothetical protein